MVVGCQGEAKLTMGPDEEMTSREGSESTYDRTRVQCRDRGEDTFQSHVDVARHTGVALDWLEDRLRAESITGFELDDGQWVTTVRGVKDLLGRKPAGAEYEAAGSWDGLLRLGPEAFNVRPRYSRAGNCVFMYFASDESWAERVDDFLTVYRSFGDGRRVVGFKLKNVTLLTSRLGDLWVEFHTKEFQIYLLIKRVLQASLSSPRFDPEALAKYHDVFQAAGTTTAGPIPAFALA